MKTNEPMSPYIKFRVHSVLQKCRKNKTGKQTPRHETYEKENNKNTEKFMFFYKKK